LLGNNHFDHLLTLSLGSKKLQTKRLCTSIFKLAYSLLSSELDLSYLFFEENCLHLKLYKLLISVYSTQENLFDVWEVMFLLNLFVNMATSGKFYILVEKPLFFPPLRKKESLAEKEISNISKSTSFELSKIRCKTRQLTNPLKKQNSELIASHYNKKLDISDLQTKFVDYGDCIEYLRVRITPFLDLIVRFIYEVELDCEVKAFYLDVIKSLVNTNYNAAKLAQDIIIQRLLLYLRLEKDENIRRRICTIIEGISSKFATNHHLNSFFSKNNFILYINFP
jgi:hypothetical protein